MKFHRWQPQCHQSAAQMRSRSFFFFLYESVWNEPLMPPGCPLVTGLLTCVKRSTSRFWVERRFWNGHWFWFFRKEFKMMESHSAARLKKTVKHRLCEHCVQTASDWLHKQANIRTFLTRHHSNREAGFILLWNANVLRRSQFIFLLLKAVGEKCEL